MSSLSLILHAADVKLQALPGLSTLIPLQTASEGLIQMTHYFFISFFLIPFFQFLHNVVKIYAGVFPENEEMVKEIAGFIYDFFLIFVLIGNNDFRGFFSYFFVDFILTFLLEVIGIRFFLGMNSAVFDFFKERMKDGEASFRFCIIPLGKAPIEAAAVSCMAGRPLPPGCRHRSPRKCA